MAYTNADGIQTETCEHLHTYGKLGASAPDRPAGLSDADFFALCIAKGMTTEAASAASGYIP